MEIITKVGFRFQPNDVELIDYYLKNKILGKLWLVHDAIREVNVCNYDPSALPALSLIKSKDNVWHFISPKEYTSPKKVSRKRSTPSGLWKSTGNDRKVKVDKTRNSAVIGTKRTLTYHASNSSNGVWTIHEYEITSLPRIDPNYVLCKLFYKGNAGDIPSCCNSTEPSHSLATEVEQAGGDSLAYFSVNDVTMIMNKPEDICPWDVLYPALSTDNSPNVQPGDGEFLGALAHVRREHVEFLFTDEQEPIRQESCDEYLLKWLY